MPDASSPTALPPVAIGDFKPSIAGLLRRIESYDPSADLTRIEAAYDVAANAHNGQRRDNGDAYITHPIAVANILAGFRMDNQKKK